MIREEELREAIAECLGARNPTSSTCVKLAAYYTILNQMTGKEEPLPNSYPRAYSFSNGPELSFGESEFSQIIKEKGISKCFPILEEVADALFVVEPRLYKSMMRRLTEL